MENFGCLCFFFIKRIKGTIYPKGATIVMTYPCIQKRKEKGQVENYGTVPKSQGYTFVR